MAPSTCYAVHRWHGKIEIIGFLSRYPELLSLSSTSGYTNKVFFLSPALKDTISQSVCSLLRTHLTNTFDDLLLSRELTATSYWLGRNEAGHAYQSCPSMCAASYQSCPGMCAASYQSCPSMCAASYQSCPSMCAASYQSCPSMCAASYHQLYFLTRSYSKIKLEVHFEFPIFTLHFVYENWNKEAIFNSLNFQAGASMPRLRPVFY